MHEHVWPASAGAHVNSLLLWLSALELEVEERDGGLNILSGEPCRVGVRADCGIWNAKGWGGLF